MLSLLILLASALAFTNAASECEQLISQAQANGMAGAFIPQCHADGSFKSEQCWASTGFCWCVDEHGMEFQNTKGRGKALVDCSMEGSRCQILSSLAQANGMAGAFIPQCHADGSFKSTQCWASTGYCWCVDEQGLLIAGTKTRGNPDCISK
ncbi:hypothetical protein OS493_013660 [Desmophyllum pertusum]|uniref:Thyroglobulin type-1 domain-containing protein n=1 Tax=Desmophyllum pertusum TaxID=174260 RepID=A0A9X0DA01_9CNID|nr:hypothetical protein OS493_013660 [Desmophyllum pertusum]